MQGTDGSIMETQIASCELLLVPLSMRSSNAAVQIQ